MRRVSDTMREVARRLPASAPKEAPRAAIEMDALELASSPHTRLLPTSPSTSPRSAGSPFEGAQDAIAHLPHYEWQIGGNDAPKPTQPSAQDLQQARQELDLPAEISDAVLADMLRDPSGPSAYMRFGGMSDVVDASQASRVEQWGIDALPGYGARKIAGDGSCWLTSAWYGILQSALSDPSSLETLQKHVQASQDVLERGHQKLPHLSGEGPQLVLAVQDAVSQLYTLRSSSGERAPKDLNVSEDDLPLLMSLENNAWVAWLNKPDNMATLRAYGRNLVAAGILDGLSQQGIALDSDNDMLPLLLDDIYQTLTPKAEQGPEAIAQLAAALQVPLALMVYNPLAKPTILGMPHPITLSEVNKKQMPVLLYANGHYSILEPKID